MAKKKKPMKKPMKKPQGVPDDATFHEEFGEWILGQTVNGRNVGEWRQWHKTDGYLTVIEKFDDNGNSVFVTYYHPDGSISQTLPYDANGKLHGVAEYWGCDNETTHKNLERCSVPNVFRLQVFFKNGEQYLPGRFFNRNGEEISILGVPKPKGLPEEARTTEAGGWFLDKSVLQEKYAGIDRQWRATGVLRSEERRGAQLEYSARYHPDGSIGTELDYVNRRGAYRKSNNDDSDIRVPKMRGDVVLIRFEMTELRSGGAFKAANLEYFNAAGEQVPATGTVRKPAADVIRVTDGRSDPDEFWFKAASGTNGEKHGTDEYWRLDGTKYLDVSFTNGRIASLRKFDEAGGLSLEEEFRAGTGDLSPGMRVRGADERPVITRFCASTRDGKVEVSSDDNGNPVTFKKWNRANELVSTIYNADLDALTIESFAQEFKRRFEELDALSGVVVFFDFFEISNTDSEAIEKPFKARTICGDGGGNRVVIIEDGKHKGAAFFNDHEEGLYSLEAVDDFLEEQGLKSKKISKDKLIEAMPFFETKLADSVSEFLKGIKVASGLTYWGHLADFKSLDGEDAAQATRRDSAPSTGPARATNQSAIAAPANGHVLELEPEKRAGAAGQVSKFLEIDVDERLGDDADHLGYVGRGVVIAGDVHIDGDVSSEQLPIGRTGFADRANSDDKHYFVVILGDLTVTGHLKVEQYYDLFVTGQVRARSIEHHSANLVVKGKLVATDLILTCENEEGGILNTSSLFTPLWVTVGDGEVLNDLAPTEGRFASSIIDDHAAALMAAATEVSGEVVDSRGYELYSAIQRCITEGKAAAFVAAFVKASGSS